MQIDEDVQKEVARNLGIYLRWFVNHTTWSDDPGLLLWQRKVAAPYVCQRGAVFEIGTLPMRVRGMWITHSSQSVTAWFTRCRHHERDRRDRFMGCRCHPVVRPDLLAAYRMVGIEAIGTKGYEKRPSLDDPNARVRFFEKPTYRASFQQMLADEWRRRVVQIVEEFRFDGNA